MSGCHIPSQCTCKCHVSQSEHCVYCSYKPLGNDMSDKLENHRLFQIEENRKVSRKIDEFEERINKLENVKVIFKSTTIDSVNRRLKELESSSRKPHKCPVCDGLCSKLITDRTSNAPAEHYRKQNPCSACEGKGIIWG